VGAAGGGGGGGPRRRGGGGGFGEAAWVVGFGLRSTMGLAGSARRAQKQWGGCFGGTHMGVFWPETRTAGLWREIHFWPSSLLLESHHKKESWLSTTTL